jgi:hypothetical protein
VEVARERLEEPSCSAADLESAFAAWEYLGQSFQDQADVPLAGSSERGFVLRIVAGDGLVRAFRCA